MNVCYTVLPEWSIGIERVRFCNIIRHEPSKGLQRTNQYSCTPHPWCTKAQAPWQCGDSARSAQIKAKREYQPVIWWFKAVVWNIGGQSSYRRVSVALLHLTYQQNLKLVLKKSVLRRDSCSQLLFLETPRKQHMTPSSREASRAQRLETVGSFE